MQKKRTVAFTKAGRFEGSAEALATRMKSKTTAENSVRVKFALNFGAMGTTMSYLSQLKVHHMQRLCLWYYLHGVSRVQTRYKKKATSPKALIWLGDRMLAIYPNRIRHLVYDQSEEYNHQHGQYCQLFDHQLFQLEVRNWNDESYGYGNRCAIFTANFATGKFSREKKAFLEVWREFPLLVSDGRRFVWALGGTKSHSTGSVYNSITDTWDNETVPRCNDGDRIYGASVYLSAYIYVYGGQSMHDSPYYDTIERWNTRDPSAVWHFVDVKGYQLQKIEKPLMTVLNETEIVIMYASDCNSGGEDDDDGKDVICVLDTRTDECTRQTPAEEEYLKPLRFCQQTQIGHNRIAALVSDSQCKQELIGWKKGDQKITSIMKFSKS